MSSLSRLHQFLRKLPPEIFEESQEILNDVGNDLELDKRIIDEYTRALNGLRTAAEKVVGLYNDPKSTAHQLEEAISEMDDSIPCEDCLQAPCRCPA